VRNEKARRYLSSIPKKKPVPFSQKFPNADPLALRLLDRMLALEPKDWPSAEEALAAPYFKGLAKVERKPSASQITKEDVEELIYCEILEYHPKMLKKFLEEAEPTVSSSLGVIDDILMKPFWLSVLVCSYRESLGIEKRQTTRKKVSKLGNLSLQKRILVVDANAVNRKVAEGVLQKYRATVTCVEGGRAALQMLKKVDSFSR
ncbi:hypothetical protein S245_006067, partial [Arachis hypogaea]